MPTTDRKQALRRTMLAQLRKVPPSQQQEHSAGLRRALAPLLCGSKALTVALYAPMPHEVDLLPLMMEHTQHRYVFPRCQTARQMEFYHVTDAKTQIRPDKRNIPAPVEGLPCIPPAEIDLILVPGVAFTRDGKRLGYGGGYYDTYLTRCPQAQTAAAAFPIQLLTDLPTEAHDLLISHIFTPDTIISP